MLKTEGERDQTEKETEQEEEEEDEDEEEKEEEDEQEGGEKMKEWVRMLKFGGMIKRKPRFGPWADQRRER